MRDHLEGLFRRQGDRVKVTLSTQLSLCGSRIIVGRDVLVLFIVAGLRLSDATARDAEAWFEQVIVDAQSIDTASQRLLTEGR